MPPLDLGEIDGARLTAVSLGASGVSNVAIHVQLCERRCISSLRLRNNG